MGPVEGGKLSRSTQVLGFGVYVLLLVHMLSFFFSFVLQGNVGTEPPTSYVANSGILEITVVSTSECNRWASSWISLPAEDVSFYVHRYVYLNVP